MNKSATRTEHRKAWWTAAVAGMASYLDAGAIVTTGTALTLFQDELGITPAQFGQLSALLTGLIAVGALIGGNLADRFGRKRIFTLTIVAYAIGAAILVAAPGVEALYIGIALLGFASGADLPPSLAMIAEVAPEGHHGKMVSLSHVLWITAIPVVNVFGVFVGGMGASGARIMYAHLLIMSIIVLVLRFSLPESQLWRAKKAAADSSELNRTSVKELLTGSYRPALIGLALFFAFSNIAANTLGQFTVYLYVNVGGTDVSVASAMNLIGLACGFVGMLLLMTIIDSKYRMVGFVVGAIAVIISFLIPGIVGVTVVTLVIMGVIYNFANGFAGEPLFKVWSQELFPTEHRSTAQGIGIAFTRAVAAAVALVTPAIVEIGPQVLFFFLAGVVVIAACIGFFGVSRMSQVLEKEKSEAADEGGTSLVDSSPTKAD